MQCLCRGCDTLEVASNQRAADQAPPIGHDEEGQFEWQRDDDRGHHHHAHRHKDGGDNKVYDQKGQKHQEPDLKSALDFT